MDSIDLVERYLIDGVVATTLLASLAVKLTIIKEICTLETESLSD